MQRRVKGLVDRLSAPHVALRLRKEEVCLAVAALSRIGSASDETGPLNALMLKQRMLQFIPSCTPTELGMISSGSLALRWNDASMADQLATRALSLGFESSAAQSKQPTLESAGWFLLANASISWRDRSLASEKCAISLAKTAIRQREHLVIQDHDQFAAAILATLLFERIGRQTSDNCQVLQDTEIQNLLELATAHCKRMSDVGVGFSLSAIAVAASLVPTAETQTLYATLAAQAVAITESNPFAVVPCALALALLPCISGSTESIRQLLTLQLKSAHHILAHGNDSQLSFKSDEFLYSLMNVAKAMVSSTSPDITELFSNLSTPNLTSSTLPPLTIALVSALGELNSSANENQIFGSVIDQINLLGRKKANKVTASQALPTSTIHKLRDAAFALLLVAPAELASEELCLAVSFMRRSNLRDPKAHALLNVHIKQLLDSGDAGGATKIVAALGSDAASLAAIGVTDATKIELHKLAEKSEIGTSAQSELNQVSLPMQFKAIKLRGEVVNDTLLMSVLEAMEEWSAGDIAYFVAAAPDKCAEFDMLIDKLSSGLEELTTEQLAFVLEAVAESSALAVPLHDAAIAQTVELIRYNKVGLEAPALIAALIRLFLKTYDVQGDPQSTISGQIVQQREELRGLIDQTIGNVLSELSNANVAVTCAFLKSFKECPIIGATAAEVCSGHLLSYVQRGCSPEELLDMLWAMAAVDVVNPELIDAIVPILEATLRGQVRPTPSFVARFLDACVALDTPELDTLFQLCLTSCVGDSKYGSMEAPENISVLRAALSIQHRPVLGKVLTQLSASVGEVKNVRSINELCGVLSDPKIVPLLSSLNASLDLKKEDVSYLARQVLEVAASCAAQEDSIEVNLSALFAAVKNLTQIANVQCEGEPLAPSIPKSLLDNIEKKVDLLTGPEVVSIICALPFFDLASGDTSTMLQVLITRLSHECDKCPYKLLSDAIFSLGELGGRIGSHITHHVAVDKLSDYCVDNVNLWTSGKKICRLLYGFSRVACNKRSLFNVFGNQLGKRPLLMLIDREDVSMVMSAFGNAKYLDKELYDALAEHMVKIADELNPADLTLVLTGYSRLNLLNDKLYQRLGERVVAISNDIPVGAATRILCAYGHVGTEHEPMANKLLANVCQNVALLDAKQCANSLYAVAQMGYNADTDQLDALADRIAADKDNLDGDSIHKVCEVMQELHWRNDPMLKAMASRSVDLLESHEENGIKPETARAVLDTLGLFMIHHSEARRQLSDTARTVSRDPSIIAEIAATGSSTSSSAQIEG